MSIDRLRAHYGFSRMPFGKDLAPGMLHAHGAHAEAVARISWCISEQAIGVVSGECGAGKTVAARAAVAGLDASRHTIVYLGTPGVGLRGIYGLIVTALGGTPKFHHAALIPQAQELLAAESAERGKQVVLIIDEAHLLDAESLEGVRCLSNMGMDQTAPFCLLLLGQPTLRRRLRQRARSPLWISGSRSATQSGALTPRKRRATCSTTSRSPGARTRCSPTTRSLLSTTSPAACRDRSTTSRSRR
jgi:type II secretory pathway predicted ATPase ExeA